MCSSTRGPAMAPVLVTWPIEEHRDALGLRQAHQARRALAHLADRAGGRVEIVHVDGLDRIDDHQARLMLLNVLDDHVQVGFGQDVQAIARRCPMRPARSLICCALSSPET